MSFVHLENMYTYGLLRQAHTGICIARWKHDQVSSGGVFSISAFRNLWLLTEYLLSGVTVSFYGIGGRHNI